MRADRHRAVRHEDHPLHLAGNGRACAKSAALRLSFAIFLEPGKHLHPPSPGRARKTGRPASSTGRGCAQRSAPAPAAAPARRIGARRRCRPRFVKPLFHRRAPHPSSAHRFQLLAFRVPRVAAAARCPLTRVVRTAPGRGPDSRPCSRDLRRGARSGELLPAEADSTADTGTFAQKHACPAWICRRPPARSRR